MAQTTTATPAKKVKTTADKKASIIKYLNNDWVNDARIEMIYNLLKMNNNNLPEVLKIAGFDTSKCWDSAYPHELGKLIRESYPEFDNGWHFYSYADKSWGEMKNAYNLFARKVIKTFTSW